MSLVLTLLIAWVSFLLGFFTCAFFVGASRGNDE